MCEIGGLEVQKALNSPKGTHVTAPTYSSTKLLDVEYDIAKLAANPLTADIFRPRIVAMSPSGQGSPNAMALALVEVLHWMKLDLDPTLAGIPFSPVICDLTYMDTAVACARAVSCSGRLPPVLHSRRYLLSFVLVASDVQDKARRSKTPLRIRIRYRRRYGLRDFCQPVGSHPRHRSKDLCPRLSPHARQGCRDLHDDLAHIGYGGLWLDGTSRTDWRTYRDGARSLGIEWESRTATTSSTDLYGWRNTRHR